MKIKQNFQLTIIGVILVIVAATGGFLTGMKYQQSKRSFRGDFPTRMGTRSNGMPGIHQTAGIDIVRGEIISQDADTITVKLADNSTKIILVASSTQINKASEGTIEDLKTGEQVMALGKKNSDESLSATQIQIGFEPRTID